MKEKELVEKFAHATAVYEELSEKVKEAKKALDHHKEVLQEYMLENEILTTADYPGIGRISAKNADGGVSFKYRGWVLKENEHLLHDWLRDIGRDDMITPSVHHARLSSFVQQQKEAGEELPEFIKTQQELKIRYYRNKGADNG